MTTTTRTTGTAAKVLAALLAVFALVSLSLVFTTGVANAGDKIWICHADANNGNGQNNLGQGGQGGENKNGFNLIEISVNAWNAHDSLHENDFPAYEKNGQYACTPFANVPETYSNTLPAAATVCFNGAVTPVAGSGTDSYTTVDGPVPAETKAQVDTNAQNAANADLANKLATTYAGWTAVPASGVCTTTTTYYCPADSAHPTTVLDGPYDATTDATTCYTTPPSTPVTPEAAAVAPVAPATVVEPATATAPEAATVAVPAPAKVTAPATVPAGDGSSVPQVPTWALALLVLGTVGLAASATRLVTAR
jgi:hypothetical protein